MIGAGVRSRRALRGLLLLIGLLTIGAAPLALRRVGDVVGCVLAGRYG